MLTTLKTLFRALSVPRVEDEEMAYLNGSANHYDLECREREIAAGRFRTIRAAY